MRDADYQSGQDRPADSRGNKMLTDIGALMRVDACHREAFRFLMRETHLADVDHVHDGESSGWLAEEDRLDERFDRMALFARLRAEIERGMATFALAPGEVPVFRRVMRDVLFAEQQDQADAEESSDVLKLVASGERVELVNSLAEQLGGLF